MRGGVCWLSRSRAVRCWAALLLAWVLAGCATVPGALPASAPPRFLLAASDGPTLGGEPTGPVVRGYTVPGRNPDSRMPWEFFLGNAAHRLIAHMYKVNHPDNRVHYNTDTIDKIVL